MEQVTKRKQIVLDALDEQIHDLEERLKKAQPLIDELATLKRTRATLLDERRATSGGGRANAQLSMETMIHYLRENGSQTAGEIAEGLSLNENLIRSHLNRYRDQRYAKNGDGKWRLIGEDAEDDTDEEDDE
jgi:predicted HTH transcriptional regulator